VAKKHSIKSGKAPGVSMRSAPFPAPGTIPRPARPGRMPGVDIPHPRIRPGGRLWKRFAVPATPGRRFVLKRVRILKTGLNPFRIAVVYAVLGAAWILGSDWIAGRWGLDERPPFAVPAVKGFLFVALTAALLYALMRMIERRLAHERAWHRE